MNGKIVLITGGNAGIGKQTAIELAKKGAKVVLLCRNIEKAQAAQADILQQTGQNVDILIGDLASFASIRQAVKEYKAKYDRLDVLINNAGIYVSDSLTTEDDFELQFGVNHLGHFLLTTLLLDTLKVSAPARIVNVSSGAHMKGKLDEQSLKGKQKGYFGWTAYAQSKLANILFTKALSKRIKSDNVTVNALHPGAVSTEIGRANASIWYHRLVWTLARPFMISIEKGAETSIYLASSPDVEGVTGKYFVKKKEKRTSPLAQDDALAERLWTISEQFVNK